MAVKGHLKLVTAQQTEDATKQRNADFTAGMYEGFDHAARALTAYVRRVKASSTSDGYPNTETVLAGLGAAIHAARKKMKQRGRAH